MYGLPAASDLDFMCGTTLTQVCLGENEVFLNFSENISISIESEFTVSIDGVSASSSSLRDTARLLVVLLGSSIAAISVDDSDELRLLFSSTSWIGLLDDDAHYESFRIEHPGGHLTI